MKSPFKFLDSYTKDDRDIFFGRDREIEELYQRVFDSKLLLVYGVSGTGKSSLIHCGLANKFRETDWLPLLIRRGGNMSESLAAEIKTASLTPQTAEIVTPSQFRKAVRSLYLDHYKPVYFIFDQFEELFILGTRDEKRAFIQIIKTLHESDLQCRFIFIMREEYMASITEFERSIPTVFQNRVRIEKMSHVNAIQAINGPCKIANISLEEGFATTLLEKLSPESADVELTYLQVFLDKIFRLAAENSPPFSRGESKGGSSHSGGESKVGSSQVRGGLSFTLDLLQKVGNVSDLLGSFLDEQISILNDPEKGLTVLKSFVSVKGTKQPMKEEEVREYVMTLGMKPDEHAITELIRIFISLRILCDKDQNDRYELRHDALAGKIFEKFTLAEKELLEVRKFVENAFFTFESRGILLNKDDLDYLAGYDNKLILPATLNEFVEKSRQKLISQRKALTRITRLSALIFILLIAAVGRYYLRNQTSSEEANQIGALILESESYPVNGIYKALEKWDKYNTSILLQRIVFQNFQTILNAEADTSGPFSGLRDEFKPEKLEGEIVKSLTNKVGNSIFGWLSDNRVFLLNLQTNHIDYLDPEGEIVHIEMLEKDSLFAIVFNNNKGIVCDLDGNVKYNFETTLNKLINERLVCFFPDGNNQLAVVKDNGADIYDKNGKIIFRLKGHSERVNSVNISTDGRFLATASNDKKVCIWNFNRELNNFSIYDSLIGHRSTVWSCEFNKTGKYILTSSADSTVRIWNLTGKQIDATLYYGENYQSVLRWKSLGEANLTEEDEDAKDENLSLYYRKFCNASFSKDELSVIATGFREGQDTSGKDVINYNRVLFYDINSSFYKLRYTTFSFFYNNEENILVPDRFALMKVSPSGNLTAVDGAENGSIDLLGPDGLRLITFEGNNALFSNDGKYLILVNKNTICRFPVDLNTIKMYLDKYKIPRSTRSDNSLLKVI
jgi:WD40 repeat protein